MNIYTLRNERTQKFGAFLLAFALMMSAWPVGLVEAQGQNENVNPNAQQNAGDGEKKVDVCKANQSSDGFVKNKISVAVDANKQGLADSGINGDIVPPDTDGYPDGQNWGMITKFELTGEQIWNNDCVVKKQISPTPVESLLLTSMCTYESGGAKWRVRNENNDFDVDFNWEIYSDQETGGPLTATHGPAGGDGDTFFDSELTGTMKIYWEDENGDIQETTKATNPNLCEPKEEPTAKVITHKIICTNESEMPQWGTGGPDITADTAAQWVNDNESCDFAKGWEFEWAPQGTSNPDDDLPDNPFFGPAGGDWTTFGPTDSNGMTTVELTADDIGSNSYVWIREVLQENYIPFTYGPGNQTNTFPSAEMYCSTDVLNYDNYDRVDGIKTGEEYYCVAWNAPEPAEVTICKYDEQRNRLSGWQIALLGEKVGSVDVASETGDEYTIADAPAGDYVLRASGTYVYRPTNLMADAALSERLPGDTDYGTWPYTPWRATSPSGLLGVQVNGDPHVWGEVFNPAHVYYASWNPTDSSNTGTFQIEDNNHTDNSGSILVEAFTGFTGVTGDDGCVTFEEVPYGEYQVEELLQQDWENVSGLGGLVVDQPEVNHTVVNHDTTIPDEPSFTVNATKIICEDPELLPQGSQGWMPITDDIVDTFLTSTEAREAGCEVDPDWQFQWIGERVFSANTDQMAGELDGWNTFSGSVTIELSALDSSQQVSLREVFQPNYIPFSRHDDDIDGDFPTAEFYCATDGANFDNMEWITDPVADDTYYCVAWNVKESTEGDDTDPVPPENGGDDTGSGNGDETGNDEEVDTDPTPTTQSFGRRSSGNAANAPGAPAPEVLGEAVTAEEEAVRQCEPLLSTYLRRGTTNDQLETYKLQAFLAALGYGDVSLLTGVFDRATDEAVRAFQLDHQAEVLTPWYEAGIVPHDNPTGWVYRTTRWKINNIYCPGSEEWPGLE